MSDKKQDKTNLSRRTFLGTAALTGTAGFVGGMHLPALAAKDAPEASKDGLNYHVGPGELDEYY